jgi:hypothetical protein
MKIKEIYKDITGFEGFYQISNFGNVRSLDRTVQTKQGVKHFPGRQIKTSKHMRGYRNVALHKIGSVTMRTVHRLVAETFIPNPNNLSQINHRNFDKTDNRVTNLEWMSPRENSLHYHGSKFKQMRKSLQIKPNKSFLKFVDFQR